MRTFSLMRLTGTYLPIALMCQLALAGCTSDEPAPVQPATASTSPAPKPSASPSPSPTLSQPAAPAGGPDQDATRPPSRPDALEGPGTKENAAAVAKYFILLFPYAVATGDLTGWSTLSGTECGYCTEAQKIVEDIHRAGNHATGGALDISGSETYINDDGTLVVILGLTQHPSQTVDPAGALVEDFPATNHYRPLIALSFDRGAWTVTGVQMDKAP